MKITSIRTVELNLPRREATTPARRKPWSAEGPVACPMTRYPEFAPFRPLWMPPFGSFLCVIEAEDGTQGFAIGNHGRPVAEIIERHLGPRLLGQQVTATEKVWDMATRMCTVFGSGGIASYAVSAVDLALWDLKGKLLGRPVYELIGGPAREHCDCYATGNDTDWHLELGFRGSKMACPWGPPDGLDGLHRNVDHIASRRELVGDGVELMLDCWMAFDVEYTVRLAEALRPYRLKWMEECLPSDDLDAHAEARARLPWQTLATGEHWFGTPTFQQAVSRRVVDILQPDINWCGGLTAVIKIVALAEAAGVSVILHGGGTTPYGQHASYALPGLRWTEFFIASPPGVPLAETWGLPGVAYAVDGKLVPSDAPGFGLEVDLAEAKPYLG